MFTDYPARMRFSVTGMANAVAWAVLFGLIAVAFVMVVILGPFGLVLLGLLTLFVCISVSLREENPTWGPEVFKARIRVTALQNSRQRKRRKESRRSHR